MTHRLVVGATGSGKSWYAWRQAAAAPRALVVDIEDQGADERPPGVRPVQVDWDDHVPDIVRVLRGGRGRLLLHYVTHRRLPVARAEVATLVTALMAGSRSTDQELLLVVDECHLFAAEGGPDGPLHEVARRGRKWGLSLLAVTQRPASVSKDLVTQCVEHVLFRMAWEGPYLSRYGLPADEIAARMAAAPPYSYLIWDGATLHGPKTD